MDTKVTLNQLLLLLYINNNHLLFLFALILVTIYIINNYKNLVDIFIYNTHNI